MVLPLLWCFAPKIKVDTCIGHMIGVCVSWESVETERNLERSKAQQNAPAKSPNLTVLWSRDGGIFYTSVTNGRTVYSPKGWENWYRDSWE
eukprot:6468820-Amphidinium_carterae.1